MGDHRFITRMMVLWLLLFGYIILHEGGHALAIILFGGKVSSIDLSLFSAHVSGSIGHFTLFQKSVMNLAGFGLPYLVWLFLILAGPKVGGPIFTYIRTYSSICIMGTIIPWIVIPILYLSGKAPVGDDVTKFIDNSGISGLAVALIFVGVLIVNILISKVLIQDFKKVILRKDQAFQMNPAVFKLMAILVVISFLGMLSPWNMNNKPVQARPGFTEWCRVNLTDVEGMDWELAKFWVEDQTKKVGIQVVQKGVSAEYIDFKMVGPEEEIFTLAKGEGYSARQSEMSGIFELAPGTYRFMLDVKKSKGMIYIFLKE